MIQNKKILPTVFGTLFGGGIITMGLTLNSYFIEPSNGGSSGSEVNDPGKMQVISGVSEIVGVPVTKPPVVPKKPTPAVISSTNTKPSNTDDKNKGTGTGTEKAGESSTTKPGGFTFEGL